MCRGQLGRGDSSELFVLFRRGLREVVEVVKETRWETRGLIKYSVRQCAEHQVLSKIFMLLN